MGFIGYFVKLIHIPMCVANVLLSLTVLIIIRGIRNNILVYVLAPCLLSTVTYRIQKWRRIGLLVICIYYPFQIISFISLHSAPAISSALLTPHSEVYSLEKLIASHT